MEKEQNPIEVINRILGSLPPSQQEDNIKAMVNLVGDDDVQPMKFEFPEIEDSFKKTFLGCDYTMHPERDDCFRSPYTGFYEPGEVFFDNPLKDSDELKHIEKNVRGNLLREYSGYFYKGFFDCFLVELFVAFVH